MFSPEIETMPRVKIREMQLERLKHIVRYAYENVPMYKERFDKIGLKPEHIKTLKDIEKIPYTTKDDLRDNYPFKLLAVPMKKIIRVHASSGTTGKPITCGYTRADLDNWSTCIARILTMAGATDEDIFHVAFGYGLFTGGFGLHYGIEKLGATVVPVSSGNTERQIMLLKDFGATALIATPSYAMYLAETAKKMDVLKDLKLRLVCMGAEASTAEMHEALYRILGAFPTENYGLTEVGGPGVSGECREKAGMHINEDMYYPEIVNIEENRALPEGEQGELVLTTLTKEGMPILRYRTKDITSLTYEPCKCGRTTARMARVVGRTDDMLIIRGVNVFPSQIESVLMAMPELGKTYEIIVDRVNYMDTIEVHVEVEDANLLTDYSKLEELVAKIKHKLRVVVQLDVKVKLVEPFSIKRAEGKVKRVTDLRKH
ncbi:MAG TPA: phenylacetate--CoA ligase [Candidatus Borkfalkia avistercoris]|uniref:Phenylacetate-coenzyme A ligase n=1 Tax=Candidatus Borkfalkia avistercoris TaxID=2838504 RepID=A0A9D2CZT9_9FIRM|nr:phenylacetate--CoA ligase [Candidatus Borkfalkia avistercoris]